MSALTPAQTRHHLFGLMRNLTALYANLLTQDDSIQAIQLAARDIKSTVIRSTTEPISGCHHPNKEKDLLVQKVLRFLSRPGVVQSVHNACVHVAGGKDASDFTWLYTWCHNHESEVLEFANPARFTN